MLLYLNVKEIYMTSTEQASFRLIFCLRLILRSQFPDVVIQINFITIMKYMYMTFNANLLHTVLICQLLLRHDSALATGSLKTAST